MTTDLTTSLTAPDPDARLRAALALGTATDADGVGALVARLGRETDPTVREALTWACVQHADAALPGVLDAMRSTDPAVRAQATHVASKIGGPALRGALDGVLADPDPAVAIKTYRAAAASQDPAVVPALAARLGQGDLELRDALSVAFARLGQIGVPALVEALGSPAAAVRLHAAEALAQIGAPDADPACGSLEKLLDDADPDVRLAAAMALGTLEPDTAGRALDAARDHGDARVAAVARALRSA